MRKLIVSLLVGLLLLTLVPSTVDARVRVRGYPRRDGIYVQPHYRSNPNKFKFDNWSSRGNSNPYTGKRGYVGW